jgi:hypothetical protein
MRGAHVVSVLERIGNVGDFREANVGETQVSKAGALTGGGGTGSYYLGERRRCR